MSSGSGEYDDLITEAKRLHSRDVNGCVVCWPTDPGWPCMARDALEVAERERGGVRTYIDALEAGRAELERVTRERDELRDVVRWHLANSACAGWPRGEVLSLSVGENPEAQREAFNRLLDVLGVARDPDDPLAALLAEKEPT